MPAVSTLAELSQAVADFAVTSLGLPYESTALAAARTSLDEAGLLLLGEVHGVAENPLLIRDLMRALQITSLALEWPDGLTDTVASFLHTGTLTDHHLLWFGDGRITAGHLRMLRDLSAAGPAAANCPFMHEFDQSACSSRYRWGTERGLSARRRLRDHPGAAHCLVARSVIAHLRTVPAERGWTWTPTR